MSTMSKLSTANGSRILRMALAIAAIGVLTPAAHGEAGAPATSPGLSTTPPGATAAPAAAATVSTPPPKVVRRAPRPLPSCWLPSARPG